MSLALDWKSYISVQLLNVGGLVTLVMISDEEKVSLNKTGTRDESNRPCVIGRGKQLSESGVTIIDELHHSFNSRGGGYKRGCIMSMEEVLLMCFSYLDIF